MASDEKRKIRASEYQKHPCVKDGTMNSPNEREFQIAIRVLDALRRSVDEADAEEGRKSAPESSEQLHARMAKSRVVERLGSIDESVEELRRWQRQLNMKQVRSKRHGHSI